MEKNSATNYSSCLQISEPFYQIDDLFLTAKLEVKNNCGVDLDIIEFSIEAKNKKGKTVEQQNYSLDNFAAGNAGSVSVDFDQTINPDRISWTITNIEKSDD